MYFTPSKSLPTTPVTVPASSLVRKFYDLVKYINVPDVLHGLENFGYLSNDQSIELFECLMQLRREYPELARALQYDPGERPVCTVVHKGVTCNSCLATDITGTRYKCAICPDYDMCEKCERMGILTHDINHPRIKMLVPSACTFKHTCEPHTHNSQGEKNAPCPFATASPVSSVSTAPTSTYHKRQHQFTTLLKKKQMRQAMRQIYIQEEERQRQEDERLEKLKREQEEEVRRAKEEKERKRQMQKSYSSYNASVNDSNSQDDGKSILWGYFDNLKKQNKLQPIVDPSESNPPPSATSLSCSSIPFSTSSPLQSSVSLPCIPSSVLPRSISPISVSGNFGKLENPTSSSPANCSSSSPPSSPLALSTASMSPPPSPTLAPSTLSASSLIKVPSSRLLNQKCIVVESPINSPTPPKPSLTPSKSKYNIAEEDDDYYEEDFDSDYESETASSSNETSELSDILREIGILHSSTDSAPATPPNKKIGDFFSSIRDLLR